jgi:hypothetical protein
MATLEKLNLCKNKVWSIDLQLKSCIIENKIVLLQQLNDACRQFLVDNGVFDSDSFISLTEED